MTPYLLIASSAILILTLIARRRLAASRSGLTLLANIAEGTRVNGILSKRTDGALGRYLCVKPGSDSDHVVVATATDTPYGVTLDEGSAAEDPVAIQCLGACGGTIKVTASAAIAVDAQVVPAAGGKVATIGAGAGSYYVVGVALQAASADGDIIEIDPRGSWRTK